MAGLDKIIKGLECCTKYGSMCRLHCDGYAGWANGTIVQYEDHHEECPYFKCETGCVITLARDALGLLKPRVLTLDEALGSDDPVYFESNGRMECWVDAYISDDLQCAVLYRFRATEFMLPLSRYKKDWRCWSSPPSYEQSKAVKWDGI